MKIKFVIGVIDEPIGGMSLLYTCIYITWQPGWFQGDDPPTADFLYQRLYPIQRQYEWLSHGSTGCIHYPAGLRQRDPSVNLGQPEPAVEGIQRLRSQSSEQL